MLGVTVLTGLSESMGGRGSDEENVTMTYKGVKWKDLQGSLEQRATKANQYEARADTATWPLTDTNRARRDKKLCTSPLMITLKS